MLRVFLVIDDYNELIYLQTLLKKLGFDVEGVQNQKKYFDLSLGFNPQILIATAHGRKVDGLQLAQSIHKRRGIPKIIVLKNPEQNFGEGEFEQLGIDRVLDSPINPKKLIHAISELGSVDEASLLDKYLRMKGTLSTSGVVTEKEDNFDENGQPVESIIKVKGAIQEVSEVVKAKIFNGEEPVQKAKVAALSPEGDTAERKLRFEKMQREVGALPAKKFDREKIREFNKKIRSSEQPEDIEEIENERRKFVAALFKNK